MFCAHRIEIFVITLPISLCSCYTTDALIAVRCFPMDGLLLAHRNVQILGGWVFAPYVPIPGGISTPMGAATRRARILMNLYFLLPPNFSIRYSSPGDGGAKRNDTFDNENKKTRMAPGGIPPNTSRGASSRRSAKRRSRARALLSFSFPLAVWAEFHSFYVRIANAQVLGGRVFVAECHRLRSIEDRGKIFYRVG